MITRRTILQFAGIMLCLLALPSVNLQSKIPVSHTLLYYLCAYSLISVSLYFFIKDKYYKKPVYICVFLYLIWAVVCIIRGLFSVKTYWVFNQLIRGTMATLVPVVIFLFANPSNTIALLRPLNRFLPIVGLLLLGWALPLAAYPYFLCPFFIIYACFLKDQSLQWRWITIGAIFIVMIALDNRSGILKAIFSLMVFAVLFLPHLARKIALNVLHWIPYAIAFTLLTLGLTGQYNFFDPRFNDPSKYITVTYNTIGEEEGDDYTQDTRTFIYVESIESAFDNDHLWTGRTPARGYSSPFFFYLEGKAEGATGIDDDERFASEVGNLNSFVWQGIVGVILFFLMYFCASLLALYRSRNIYVKMIGVLVAFHWAFGWIENTYQFFILDITLFLMMAICYSPYFRKMSDVEFKLFIKDIFANPSEVSRYAVLKVMRLELMLKLMKQSQLYTK